MPDSSDIFTIRSETQLLALLDVKYGFHLVTQFKGGATASEAARAMGEPAQRVSYYVSRLVRLGLLVPAPGGGRGKRLVASGRRFVVPHELLGLLNREQMRPMLTALTEAFLASSHGVRTDELSSLTLFDLNEQGWQGSTTGSDVRQSPIRPGEEPAVLVQMMRLTPGAYERVMHKLWQVIQDEKSERDDPNAKLFTLALMGFRGSMLPLKE